ncbi:putative bifunctional diguanylate cyclase/phosphodiesterase [Roseibium sp. Sym1]|uniref:putative bifunctional diguanylate cyclase/phosphodiesterase n=1 Tax=Roseibium sp. Sym1 TaxID=3016006 RepID=UPI0022B38E13|nr:EAL domain-containing protein [Roseibium sp. Sym1]
MIADGFHLSADTRDLLFPLHVSLTGDGRIDGVGPTLKRVLGQDLLQRDFLDVFNVERPRNLKDFNGIRERLGTKLIISAASRDGKGIQFRGVAIPLEGAGGAIFVDLSFGRHLTQVVERFGLTEADFKPNDFSIDLFYSFEAQRTLLQDSHKMASALKSAKVEAERRASQDPLTGIANRGALQRRLEEMLQVPDQTARFALLHIDLDDFKSVNDNLGHSAGDRILKQTASVLKEYAGWNDLPARLGGDEFALVMADPPNEETLLDLAQDLLTSIGRPIRLNGHRCAVSASIGIALFNAGDVSSADRLIANSDIALYDAKATKSAVKLLSEDMVARHDETTRLISEIEAAIRDSQFVPHFQPQIDTVEGCLCGLEVLARWEHPEHGILAPVRFLETATRANIMVDIDRLVRRKAFAQFRAWKQDGRAVGKLSLNVTATNLRSLEYISELQWELAEAGLSPADIQLELLESILFDQSDQELIAQCRDLEQAGFALALDDFGTGHSSIATLIETPVAILKIDRSFITGLDTNAKVQRIAGAMLAMANTMGLDVLAEGVETRQELDFLEKCGCRYFQGYYFSPPRSAFDIELWLDQQEPDLHRSVG